MNYIMLELGQPMHAFDRDKVEGEVSVVLSDREEEVEALDGKRYKVAGWAPVAEAARDAGGEPVWELVARNLRAKKNVKAPVLNLPKLKNVDGNPGMAA